MAIYTAEVYFRDSNIRYTVAYRDQHLPPTYSLPHLIPLHSSTLNSLFIQYSFTLIPPFFHSHQSSFTLTTLFFHSHTNLLSLSLHSSFTFTPLFFHSHSTLTTLFHSHFTNLLLSFHSSFTVTLLFFHSNSTHSLSTLLSL